MAVFALQPYLIVVGGLAVAIVLGLLLPSGLSAPGSDAARSGGSPQPRLVGLPWTEPAITVRAPVPSPITSSQFGADIVNFDDLEWGPGSDASWPPVSLGIDRIWDDGTTWRNVEPSDGHWDFSTLDEQVDQARSKGAEVLYVLGQTPLWASSRPGTSDLDGAGAPAPPSNMSYWQQYVSTVASRYKGKVSAYEVWDEADGQTFYGSPEQMVQLATIAYETIKRIDPQATVLTPSFTQNALTSGWLAAYLSAGGAKVADAFAGHAYASGPEGAASYLLQYRAALARAGSKLPIWMTEIGYQGYSAKGRPLYSAAGAEAVVARTIMDQAVGGAARIIWYGANANGMWLSLGEQGYPGDATAYRSMLSWLVGSRPIGCGGVTSGQYGGLAACYLTTPRGAHEVILYDSNGTIRIRGPAGAFVTSSVTGKPSVDSPGTPLVIGASPTLVIPDQTLPIST